ncbi:MAG: tandem-95 repeat protein, partial [Armatimonadetes bacterium]|nr:tandem-95 repeat protein [Armatimonadota bacterium]
DSDPDGDPLTITAVTQPAHGTSAINGASVTYTPSADFSGTDFFTYTISDGTHTATATVNVTVIAVDDSPMEVTASIYATGFDAPISVSVNPTDGSVWVANYGSGQIVHLAQNGSEMWRGTSFHTPRSVSVNPNDGSCWVADEGLSRVTHLASNGTTMWSGTSFDHPEAVSVNAADNSVWVADTRNNQVVHLRVDGAELSRSAFTSPQSVSVNPNDGSCWVAGTSTPQIAHLAEDGSELWSGGTLSGPLSVSVNPVDGSCWVIDHTAYKVAHYAADGTELWKGGTGLYLPKSVSVNSTDGSSWVANTWNNEVMHLAADGSELWRGADFSRPASVSVNSTDGSCWVADTNNNRVVHLLLSPVNQPPVASDDSISTNEDVATSGSLSANDPEDDPMVYSIVSNGTLGTAIITDPLTGAFTYTPNPDANGTDTFTFKVNDGEDDSNVATVTVNIAPINDPPVAGDDIVTTPEDTPILIRILDNDTDVDAGDTLSLYRLWVHGGAAGSMGNNGDGTLTYYPKANWTGTDDWGFYDVSDGHGGTDRADLIIIVTPVNDPPVAVDDSATTSEDTSVLIDVLANDSDVEGPLSVIQASQPSHGSVVLVGDTSITYTPAPNYNGTDAFTYMVRDLDGVTATATVSVTIAPVNDPPVAVDDSVVTDEDTAVVIAVLANDTDVDGDDLTISTQLGYFVPPTHGQAIINADGTITYTPDANYAGSDSFQYCVEDPSGLRSGMATVSITVNPVNDPPVAVDDSATVGEDRSVIIGVLMNDTDVDDGALTVSVATPPANGTLTVNPNNSITYTPATNYFGTDSFTYTASDAAGATATATVIVTIDPEDDPPVANDDTADTPEDTPVVVSVLANDDEVDGEMLSVVGITQPAHGVATHNANDTVTYAPAQDYSGSDSFTYTITDGHTTQTATVQITVTPVNDPPVVVNVGLGTHEDTPVSALMEQFANDVEGDILTFSIVTPPSKGSAVIAASQWGPMLTYTPNLNATGDDPFTFKANDGQDDSNIGTMTIHITPVNDPPTAGDDSLTIAEDTTSIMSANWL